MSSQPTTEEVNYVNGVISAAYSQNLLIGGSHRVLRHVFVQYIEGEVTPQYMVYELETHLSTNFTSLSSSEVPSSIAALLSGGDDDEENNENNQQYTEIDLATLVADNKGILIKGIDALDNSGYSVSNAGDWNNDGIADIIISAIYADPDGASNAGESYIVYGRATSDGDEIDLATLVADNNGVLIKGIDADDNSGWSVSYAGDWNNDGVADVIIGARWADLDGVSDAGESYIVYGRATSDGDEIDLATLVNDDNGILIKGIDWNDLSGMSVSYAGDWNNDGVADVIIGANGGDPDGASNAGESYIVFGRQVSEGGEIDLATLVNDDNGFLIKGIDANDNSGWSVSYAGDWNNDGVADVIIGATGGSPDGASSAGESYIVFGRQVSEGGEIDLATLVAEDNGFLIKGIDANDFSGWSVSNAGDWNNDGVADVIIGANGGDPDGDSGAGESYIIFGRQASEGGEIDLATLVADNNGVLIKGIDRNDESGYSVSYAGDWNEDGIDDVIIGAYFADPDEASGAGESYIVYGRATSDGDEIDLATLVADNNGVLIKGIDALDTSGWSVSGAGDWNNDGIADVVIGAKWADPDGASNAGETYIVYGSDEGA